MPAAQAAGIYCSRPFTTIQISISREGRKPRISSCVLPYFLFSVALRAFRNRPGSQHHRLLVRECSNQRQLSPHGRDRLVHRRKARSLRRSSREICICPMPKTSAIFAWVILRPFRISASVMRRATRASNSFPRARMASCRFLGSAAVTSSTEIIARIA